MTVSRISPSSERETYHEAVRSTGVGSVSFTVCTMRPKGDWNTGLRACLPTVATAGGVETRDFYAAKLNGSRPVGSQLLQGGWHPLYRRHETTIKWLADVYEWHHANVCYKEGERIWLNADSAANWAVLCKKPPLRFTERCRKLARRNICWPHLYAKASRTSKTAACTSWPAEQCGFRLNTKPPLPSNRTNEGSIEGAIEGQLEIRHLVWSSTSNRSWSQD